MAYWIINSLIVFALCVLLAGVLIPQILLIAYRRKLFDEVDERKIHKGLIPRLGGIAFVPVILLSVLQNNFSVKFFYHLYTSFCLSDNRCSNRSFRVSVGILVG